MRLLLLILLTTKLSDLCGQVTYLHGHGDYESSKESYRTNYFLSIKAGYVALYGWEITQKHDTIFYKATAHLKEKTNYIKFTNFQFSRLVTTRTTLDKFQPDKEVLMPDVLLHKYLNVIVGTEARFEVLLTKDVYDSNADKFVFARIK